MNLDISEIWNLLRLAVLPIAAWILFRFGKRIPVRWLRRSTRLIAAAMLILSTAFLVLVTLVGVGCTRRQPKLYSNDGRHVALVEYDDQGALGGGASVSIRRKWLPYAERVYSGPGGPPHLHWIGSSKLTIEYFYPLPYAFIDPPFCKPGAAGVDIECVNRAIRKP